MAIYTFDDGSTIDTEQAGTPNGATPATNGSPLDYREYNPFGSVLTPQGQQQVSRGSLIENALAYGFGRWVDSRTMPQGYSQQAPSQYVGYYQSQRIPVQNNGQLLGDNNLLLLALLGVGALALSN